jgi:hypothetical protein
MPWWNCAGRGSGGPGRPRAGEAGAAGVQGLGGDALELGLELAEVDVGAMVPSVGIGRTWVTADATGRFMAVASGLSTRPRRQGRAEFWR